MTDNIQMPSSPDWHCRKAATTFRKLCGLLMVSFAILLCSLGQAAAQTNTSSKDSAVDTVDSAADPKDNPADTTNSSVDSMASPDDSLKRVQAIQRKREKKSLIDSDGLKAFYAAFDAARGNLYKSTGLKLGFFHSTLFQAANRSLPKQDKTAIATITGLYGTLDVLKRGDPSAGQISFGLEGRWGYGDYLTPSELGPIGIGSATGTTDPYGATQPAVVLREVFWRWGAPEKKWNYRIGKITPDRLLTGSDYIDPVSLGLPVGSQGSPSVGFPDSGLGFAVGLYPAERFRLGIVVSDANGDRYNWGDISEGNFFKAIEFQAQLFPLTENAGFSNVTFWHTDGTDDPADALDSSTGETGWGFFVKLEQELSKSGKDIGMIRYGHSYDDAAVYKQQASIRYVRLDPPDPISLKDDRFGIAASWVDPLVNPADRTEWGFDTFYRFNLMERIETTLAYQVIFDPTFNTDTDSVQVFSFRFTQFF